MIIKKYIDVKTTLNYNYVSSSYVFDAEKGLDIAVAFTAYDNEEEIILDKTIGELAFFAYEWGENSDGSVFVKREWIPSY